MNQKISDFLNNLNQKFQSFKETAAKDLKTLWNENRVFLILFGAVIFVLKFRDAIIDLLISSAKREMKKTQDESNKLQGEENKDNAQANQLIKDANQLGQNKSNVDDDWYKK